MYDTFASLLIPRVEGVNRTYLPHELKQFSTQAAFNWVRDFKELWKKPDYIRSSHDQFQSIKLEQYAHSLKDDLSF